MTRRLCVHARSAQSSNGPIQRRSPRNEDEIDREREMTKQDIGFNHLVHFY